MSRICYCDKYDVDQPYDIKKHCRLCWLYHNNLDYKRRWDMPTTQEQIKNFAKALEARVVADFKDVDDESYEARLKICEKCDRRTDDWRCTGCGCFLTIKAKWASETCPEGKWALPVINEKKGECNCGKKSG